MFNRLFVTVSLGLVIMANTNTPGAATEDLLRHVGFGGVCADCDLSGKDLSDVAMQGASFPRANFTGTNLTKARISGANFGKAVFKRADLTEALLEGSNFARCDMTGAKLDGIEAQGINLSYAVLNGVQGADAELIGSNLSHSSMVGAKMQDAVFDNSNLSYADLSRADLKDSSLQNTRLFKAVLDGAKLVDADFEGANLKQSEFGRADVRGANFEEAMLVGADLSHVKGLRQEQLDGACGDAETALPENLTLPICDEAEWVNAQTRNGLSVFNYSFSFDMSDEDRAALDKATREAVRESGYAMQKARIALAEALTDGNYPKVIIERDGQTYSWPNFDDVRSEEQRALARAQRALDGLELNNRRAQRALDVAVRSLAKAQAALRSSHEEQELAGRE